MGKTCSCDKNNDNTFEYNKINRNINEYYYDGFYDLQPHDIIECSIIEE